MKRLACPNCPNQKSFTAKTLERHDILVDDRDEFIEDLDAYDVVRVDTKPKCAKCGADSVMKEDDERPIQLDVRAKIAELKCNDYPPGAIVTELLKLYKPADLVELLLFAVRNSSELAPDPVGEVGVTGPKGPTS